MPHLAARLAEMELVVSLAKDAARIRAQVDAGAAWTSHGDEPWLVTVTSAQPPLPAALVIVSSRKMAPPNVTLRARAGEGELWEKRFRACGPSLHQLQSNRKLRDPAAQKGPFRTLAA